MYWGCLNDHTIGCIPRSARGYSASIVLTIYRANGIKSFCVITVVYPPSLSSTLSRNR